MSEVINRVSLADAGNTFSKATNLTETLNKITGTLSSSDPNDWYKFNPTSSGAVTIKLFGLTADADVYLYQNPQSNYIARPYNSERTDELISTQVTAGQTYYIKVNDYNKDSINYSLSVNLPAASPNSIVPNAEITADQIYDKAMSYVTTDWGAFNCTGFVYTVSHVLGHDFFTNNDASYAGNKYNNALINNDSSSVHDFVIPISSNGNNNSQENRGDWTAIYHEQANGSTSWLTDIAAGDFIRATFSKTVHSGVVAGYDELNQKLYLIDNYNNITKIEVKAHDISSINVTNGIGVKQGWVDVSRYNGLGNNSNDSLSGSNADDIIGGGGGNDIIIGGAGADKLFGNSGNDTLNGGIGFDHLYGGSGNDTFELSIALKGNADKIYDFTIGEDKIALSKGVFTKFTNETTLLSDYFSNKGKARDSNDYITYNKKTGDIYYDADGNGIQEAAIMIAVLNTKPPELSASDFIFIA